MIIYLWKALLGFEIWLGNRDRIWYQSLFFKNFVLVCVIGGLRLFDLGIFDFIRRSQPSIWRLLPGNLLAIYMNMKLMGNLVNPSYVDEYWHCFRLKVIELEKQVNNLSTTNDVLLTQNAKLRTNKVVPFQNTANPQQQQNQQQQQQPVNPPIQPVQQPTPVSIHCGYPSVAVTNSNSINNNNLSIPNFGMNYGSQSNEAPPPPPPVIVQNNMGGYNTNINSTFNANGEHHTNNSTPLPAQNHIQTRNVLQPQQHLQTAIQVPNGAAVGAVHLTTHPRNPNATTVANVNAAVPYFITQLTPNFTPLNGTHAAAASLNPSAVQSAAQAVAAAPSGSIRAAILPHPANQVRFRNESSFDFALNKVCSCYTF